MKVNILSMACDSSGSRVNMKDGQRGTPWGRSPRHSQPSDDLSLAAQCFQRSGRRPTAELTVFPSGSVSSGAGRVELKTSEK